MSNAIGKAAKDLEAQLDIKDQPGVMQRTAGDVHRDRAGNPYPLNSDGKRKKVGRGSNAGAAFDAGFGLQKKRDRERVQGITIMADQLLREIGPYPEDWDLTQRHVTEKLDAACVRADILVGAWDAADRGTLLHSVMEITALQSIDGADQAEGRFDHLTAEAHRLQVPMSLLESAGDLFDELWETVLEPLAAETKMVNDRWRRFGTIDLIGRLRQALVFGDHITLEEGTIRQVDLKTGSLDFSPMKLIAQGTVYACGSEHYVIEGDDVEYREQWPWPLEDDFGLILHLPLKSALETGTLELTWALVDYELGLSGLRILEAMEQLQTGLKLPKTADGKVVGKYSGEDMADLLEESVAAVTHRKVEAWLTTRLELIGANRVARPLVMEMWPDDVPPLSEGIHPDHVDGIASIFAYVEAEARMAFGERDPRKGTTGHHSAQ